MDARRNHIGPDIATLPQAMWEDEKLRTCRDMLAGIETGYEGKHDFPLRDSPPGHFYLLATVPRSGSSYVSHLLWSSGCLGAPLEYLNFDPNGPYGFAASSPENQQRLWRSVLRRRTSPNGVFGVKAFPGQLQLLQQVNPRLLNDLFARLLGGSSPPRIIYLERRDRIAHAVSYARAALSGVWRAEQEGVDAPDPDYSERAIERMGRSIDAQCSAWEQMFRDIGIAPLRLWYEDIIAEPDSAVAKVAGYLGIAVDLGAAVEVPQVRKQNPQASADWAERYARSADGR